MRKISVIGAGSFGTALSIVLNRAGNDVQLWAREPEIVRSINEQHQNPEYLPDLTISEAIVCYNNLEETLKDRDIILFATPSHAVREVAKKVKPHLSGNEIVVNVAKGIEQETFLRMSEVLAEVLDGVISEDQIGVLSGPSHAEEVSRFRPTTVVASANAKSTAKVIQDTFMTPMFRVYVNPDIIGVEVGGAVKNVIAIATGIVDGSELGDNAKAALITRGLHEIKRLARTLGASQDTLSGLTGMGDLIVTCTSEHSRNRGLGFRIGKGEEVSDILESMTMVAEGVKTTKAVYEWAKKLNIEMPITEAMYEILFEGRESRDMLYELMTRNPKEEILI